MMKKTIVSLAAGFLLTGAAATSVSAQEYKVQDGDTLSGVSQEFNVSVDDLKMWNDLDSDLIVVDQLLDIQDEDASNNANNQGMAPADEQAQQEAPAEPSDDQTAEEENNQEMDQPEADEEEASEEEEPSEDQAAEQEDPNEEAPQQEANDEAVENDEDEAVEQEPANDEDEAVEQEPANDDAGEEQQEPSDDQAANQEEETDNEDNDQDADTSEGKTITMNSTAYTAGCEGCSGTTADGTELSGDENVVAVDPDEIPIGSEVHVEGYGDAVAADTGGDINGDRIDLHMGDEGEANDWGRQDVKVTVK